jgi:ribosome recycling factor
MSNIQQTLKDARAGMDKDIAHVKHEFSSVRSGKASPNMLDTVRVEMYGQQMQLNQVATINAPEPRVLIVTPFDKSQIKIVEKAIREAELGLEPSAQGAIIRVPLPAMNEQRRKELVKVVHKYARTRAKRSRSSPAFRRTTSSTPRRTSRSCTTITSTKWTS